MWGWLDRFSFLTFIGYKQTKNPTEKRSDGQGNYIYMFFSAGEQGWPNWEAGYVNHESAATPGSRETEKYYSRK